MEFATGVLPLLGVALGAFLQYRLARSSSERERLKEIRAEAYAMFVRAVSYTSLGTRLKDEEMLKGADAALGEAKAKIAIYGSREVICALAGAIRKGGDLADSEVKRAYIETIHRMRHDYVAPEELVADKELAMLLYSLELK